MVSEKAPPTTGLMVIVAAVFDWPAARPVKLSRPLAVTSIDPLASKPPDSRSARPAAVLVTPRMIVSDPLMAPRSRV